MAPPEIRADLQTILTAFDEEFLPVLAAANWNFLDAGEELDAISDNPAFEAAQERLETYDTDVCGLDDEFGDLGDGSGDGTEALEEFFTSTEGLEALLGSDFGRQAIIEGFTEGGEVTTAQAECLLDNLDVSLLASLGSAGVSGTDSEALAGMLGVFDTCGISPDQFG